MSRPAPAQRPAPIPIGQYRPKARHPERDAFDQLLADLVVRGSRPVCAGRTEWLSEDPDDRAEAAAACGYCPIRLPCQQLAQVERPTFGVWGGADWTRPPGRPARAPQTHGNRPRNGQQAANQHLDAPRPRNGSGFDSERLTTRQQQDS